MDWARILAYVTGMVDQELLARNEYLAAENRILKAQLKGRLKLSLLKTLSLTRSHRRIRTRSPNDCNRPLGHPYAVRLLQAAAAA